MDQYSERVRVFIRHGVSGTKNMVGNYGRFAPGFTTDRVHASSERERRTAIREFRYRPAQVRVTGLPRFDRLFEPTDEPPSGVLVIPTWREWIRTLRRQVGMVDVADLIYVHSEHYWQRQGGAEPPADGQLLFGEREGRIALANRRKDPLFLFSSLQRQLGYPQVPRVKPADKEQTLLPQLARRLEQLEMRLKLVEDEQRGGVDLTQFYERPPGPIS